MTYRFFTAALTVLFLFVPALAGVAQCAETHVENATFFVPPSAAPDSFSGSDTITATTKTHDVCAAESVGKPGGFALAIRSNDTIVDTNAIEGAVEGERFVLHAGEKSVSMTLEDSDAPLSKTVTEYEDGALYVASSFDVLEEDSSKIGFEADTLYTVQDSATVDVSVTLPSADTLTGVQVDMPFSGPVPNVTKSYSEGTLETNQIADDTLRVLLYTVTDTELPKESALSVTTAVTAGGQSIGLTDAYATTGGPGSTVEVDLNIGQSPVYIAEGTADVVVQTDSLSYDETTVGNPGSESIVVENEGTVDATVSTGVDNALFSAPENVSVPAGTTEPIPVTFAPTMTEFGSQSGVVSVAADGDTSDVFAAGTGVGGRGDPTLNGTVNVSDVVMTADIILGEVDPDTSEMAAADVYPVSDGGDGTIKISDLQSTSGAILSGSWEDGVGLAASAQVEAEQKTASASEAAPKILLKEVAENETKVYFLGEQKARGVQVKLDRSVSKERQDGVSIESRSKTGLSRVLAYRQDGAAITDDSLHIATARGDSDIEVSAMKTNRRYESSDLPVSRVESVSKNKIGVYPNPVRSRAKVSISLVESVEGVIEIFDTLGRRVRLVKDREFPEGEQVLDVDLGGLSSGVYFARLRTERFNKTEKITVVR